MKIAIIGAAGHYKYALKQLPSHQVVGIAPGYPGEDLSKLRAALAKIGIRPKEAADWQELLPLAEVAVVNTRFDLNSAVTQAFLERDVFVFSEKPLALSLEELERVKAANAASRAFVSGMFGIRYSSWFLTLQRALPRIGSLRLVNAQKSYKLGVRPAFYQNKETFGGLIPWVAIHGIDWILTLLGNDPVASLSALTDAGHNGGNGDLEVTALCQFRSKGGVLGSVSADYFRPQGAPTHDDDRLRAVGTRGILEAVGGRVTLTDGAGTVLLPPEEEEDVFALFLKRVAGEEAGVSPEESFLATEIALRAEALAQKRE